jgi:hypothetical protein
VARNDRRQDRRVSARLLAGLCGAQLAILLGSAAAQAPGPAPSHPAPGAPVPAAPEPTAFPTAPPPLTQGPAPDLDLVFTAQVAGWIEPCG